jgi:cell division protein ZapA (FtsZ GTPase activity inhibitor)
MPRVDFTVLGHTHRLTCQTGEEARLQLLAEKFNTRAESVAESLRTTDHKLIYIVTALTLLDEAEETKRQDSVPSTETTRILELIRNKALKIKHKLA